MATHKPHLLLLHGALGTRDQFTAILPLLSARFQLHLLDFEGHGARPAGPRPFRIEHFAENILEYLRAQAVSGVYAFGYSMGGYAALWAALNEPAAISRIITLGTKFHWDPETAVRERRQLDPARIQEKVPRFAQALRERHTALGWQAVLARTAEMLSRLGDAPLLTTEVLGRVSQTVRLMVGDRDLTVSLEETIGAYRALPAGQLVVLPDTPHPFEKVSLELLVGLLAEG